MPKGRPMRKYSRVRDARRRIPRYLKTGVSVATTAYRAFALAKKLADKVNVEYKHDDNTQSGAEVNYNGAIGYLNNMAQGDTDVTRDGDSIKCQRLVLRGWFLGNATVAQTCRLIIFWDQAESAGTTVNSVLDSTYTGSVLAPLSPKEHDFRFQTRFLYDSGPVNVPTQANNRGIHEFNLNIPINLHTQFAGASTTIKSGALKYLIIGTNAPSTNNATFSMVARLSYTDN